MESEIRATVGNLVLSLAGSCESPIEEMFIQEWAQMCRNSDCPLADLSVLADIRTQYELGEFRLDFAFPQVRLAVELDGHEFHSSKEARTNDARRDRSLHLGGWTTLRFTGTEMHATPEVCVRDVRDAILRAQRHETTEVQSRFVARGIPDISTLERFRVFVDEKLHQHRKADESNKAQIVDDLFVAIKNYVGRRGIYILTFDTREESEEFDQIVMTIYQRTRVGGICRMLSRQPARVMAMLP